ncbi:MAG TPA: hypothetical protein VH437_10870 [Terriglobales bacterium]|jgi:hypothetical protein
MDPEKIAKFRAELAEAYDRVRRRIVALPMKARLVLGFLLLAALFTVLHTALSGADSNLRVTVQHSFRTADFSLWIDDHLAYAGKLTGSTKRKFGVLPGSVQGTLSQTVGVDSGSHTIKVKIASEDGSIEEQSINGDFAQKTERELLVSARAGGLALGWRATVPSESTQGSSWFSRYAGALFLTIAGSILSTLTGFALKELPSYLQSQKQEAPKAQSTAAGQ